MLASAIFVALAASVSTVSAQVAIANANAQAIAIAGAGGATGTPAVPTVTTAPISNVTIPSGCYPTVPCTSTVTAATTSTYCPVCDHAISNGLVYTTTYVVAYQAVCPTGYTTSTYTVTAVATGSTPVPAVPTGFTTTQVVCSACPGTPTVVVTTPAAAGTTVVVATTPTKVAVYTGAANSNNVKTIGAMAGSFGSLFAAMLFL